MVVEKLQSVSRATREKDQSRDKRSLVVYLSNLSLAGLK
jgi:hypothetical protein